LKCQGLIVQTVYCIRAARVSVCVLTHPGYYYRYQTPALWFAMFEILGIYPHESVRMTVDIKQHRGLGLLLVGACAALAGATVVDYPLTKWLGSHGWAAFAEFMGRSLFEGEHPGGGDLVIFFLLGVVCLYAVSLRPKAPERVAAWRPTLGFMVVSSILTAFAFVHTLKWLVARARPNLVFDGHYAFSAWYEMGPHFITEGIYHGSFTSGHTAQAFVLMVLAYALAGNPAAGRGLKAVGWLVGALVVVFALGMGLARCMSLSHWVTDVVGAVVISWVTLHVLYFDILKVPQQQRARKALDRAGDLRVGWELFLAFYLLAAFLGILVSGIGLRALWVAQARWLAILLVPGIPAAVWGFRRSAACCRDLYRGLAAIDKERIAA
jgi:membrane-associated phospholipid phosphatase